MRALGLASDRSVTEHSARLLVLDNRDSFVFNLVDEFRRRGAVVLTLRSQMTIEKLNEYLGQFRPEAVVLSPGPGRPEESGVMVPWLRSGPSIPVLGICLGHQAIAVAAGGRVEAAPRLIHGRASPIDLRPDPLFEGIASPLLAGRYHSLVVTEVPDVFSVIATVYEDGKELVMGIRHRLLPQVGLQFHPESILTPQGGRILWKFVKEALETQQRRRAPSSNRVGVMKK